MHLVFKRSCGRRPAYSGVRRSLGFDRCLYIKDRTLRRQCITWRCNFFLHRRRCKCGAEFNRAHVTRCTLLGDGRTQQIASALRDQHLANYPHLREMQYTEVDALLNHREYGHLAAAFNRLIHQLVPGQHPQPESDDES